MFYDVQIVYIEYIRENYKNAAIRGITLLNEPLSSFWFSIIITSEVYIIFSTLTGWCINSEHLPLCINSVQLYEKKIWYFKCLKISLLQQEGSIF